MKKALKEVSEIGKLHMILNVPHGFDRIISKSKSVVFTVVFIKADISGIVRVMLVTIILYVNLGYELSLTS